MNHYSISEFLLFLRAGLPADRHQEIAKHLEEGCFVCSQTCEFAIHFQQTVTRDCSAKPPEWVLNRARAIMELAPQKEHAIPEITRTAALVFDSFSGLQLAVRGAAAALDRHLVFRQDSLLIDLFLPGDVSDNKTSLFGQVQSEAAPEQGLAGLTLLLVDGATILDSAKTGNRGEFVLSAPRRVSVDLLIVGLEHPVKIHLGTTT